MTSESLRQCGHCGKRMTRAEFGNAAYCRICWNEYHRNRRALVAAVHGSSRQNRHKHPLATSNKSDSVTSVENPAAELLSTADAARILGIGKDTVLGIVHAGEIPAIRLGGKPFRPLRFRRADLDSTLKSWTTQ
jgi:excisionase family DNA binding protein